MLNCHLMSDYRINAYLSIDFNSYTEENYAYF